jgi:NTP pyrophosphatase (non-canonical NTP hydrolase)
MIMNDMITQCTSDSARWFPGEAQSLANLTLCMCGEAGEVANLVKKIVRGSLTVEQAMDLEFMGTLDKDTLQEEIVDVLIYLANLMGAEELKDIDWKSIWDAKREFNEKRFA